MPDRRKSFACLAAYLTQRALSDVVRTLLASETAVGSGSIPPALYKSPHLDAREGFAAVVLGLLVWRGSRVW